MNEADEYQSFQDLITSVGSNTETLGRCYFKLADELQITNQISSHPQSDRESGSQKDTQRVKPQTNIKDLVEAHKSEYF